MLILLNNWEYIQWLKQTIQTENTVLTQGGPRSGEPKDAAQVESYVAQRYIENPYLINGNKLDEQSNLL